jgi:SAM-dependent methyltransferase
MTDTPEPALYADYGGWKGWENPFVCPPDLARYYEAELRGRSLGGAQLLEIGFGNGEFLGWAKAQGAVVTGSELTPAAIAAAKAAEIPLIPSNFETGAIEAAQFDIIAAFDVFEHLNPEAIIAKLAAADRMLKPDGWLILRFPNGQSPFGLAPQNADATHITALSREKIEQYAARTGLRTLHYGGVASGSAADPLRTMARKLRLGLRKLHIRWHQFLYANDTPLDPVVTHILVKTALPR